MTDFLTTKTLTHSGAVSLLDLSQSFAQESHTHNLFREAAKTHTGKNVFVLFYENSTRTRVSFEMAARRLGANVTSVNATTSSVSKGESLKDTVQTLDSLGADCLVLRHSASGAPSRVVNEKWFTGSVINAGDGTNEHPSQAIGDALTIRQKLCGNGSIGADLSGISVVILGDILHSRVARSNAFLLTTLGATVTYLAAPTLLPRFSPHKNVTLTSDIDRVFASKPDVVMVLRVQQERVSQSFFPGGSEFLSLWGVTEGRAKSLAKTSLILHPGPCNRGTEIAATVVDSPRTMMKVQVTNGVIARMALLDQALSRTELIRTESIRTEHFATESTGSKSSGTESSGTESSGTESSGTEQSHQQKGLDS